MCFAGDTVDLFRIQGTLNQHGYYSEGKVANKCSAYVGTPSTVGKAFQVKLVERVPRVCKAVKTWWLL